MHAHIHTHTHTGSQAALDLRFAPLVHVLVMDEDRFSADDYMGSTRYNLCDNDQPALIVRDSAADAGIDLPDPAWFSLSREFASKQKKPRGAKGGHAGHAEVRVCV